MRYEIRSTPKGKTMFGYAVRYGVLSNMLNGFRERIQRGAFDAVLRSSPNVVCLFNHNADQILGRTGSKTLRLISDASGLRFECDLPNTSYAADLAENLRNGNTSGCSFAFGKLEAEDQDFANEEIEEEGRKANVLVRTIRNIRSLLDVSIVTNPAYPGTSVALRSLDAARGLERHFDSRSNAVVRSRVIRTITAAELNAKIDENYCSFDEVAEFAASERARRRRLIQQALQ